MRKWLILPIVFAFLMSCGAYAQEAPEKVRNDNIQIGEDNSTGDKAIIFDTGDGAGNPEIQMEQATREFSFTKLLHILGDLLSIGDGTNGTDKVLEFDTGDGVANRKLTVDTAKDGFFSVNNFSVGDGATSDKQLIFDIGGGVANPRYKWDQTAQKLQFSNDGSTFKNIGSGGGGSGINLLTDFNADCEAGSPPSNWTETGGTFAAETTSPGYGAQSCAWNPSITGQFLRSNVVNHEIGMLNKTCTARIKYIWTGGVAGDIKWHVETDGDVLISTDKDLDPSSEWREDVLIYTCPISTDNIRIEFESTADAANLIFDSVELGQSGLLQVSQAEIVAAAKYPGVTNCLWSVTSASFSDFPVDADCSPMTVQVSSYPVNLTENDLPQIVFDDLPKGRYEIEVLVVALGSVSSAEFAIRLSDGTTNGPLCSSVNGSASNIYPWNFMSCKMVLDYTTSGARTFKVQASSSLGAVQLSLSNGGREMSFIVKRFPLDNSEAVTLETTGWHVDVNIGGTNGGMFLTTQSTYIPIASAAWDLVVNPGSSSAEIPCASPNPSTGLTCAVGDETIGVVIDIPTTGRYKVCGEFSHFSQADVAGSLSTTFQWIETSNTGTAIIQEGKSRILSSQDPNASNSYHAVFPNNLCGTFEFGSVGKKTLRLMYEQLAIATVTQNGIIGDRSASQGGRDIHITVEKMDQQFPTPVFTDLNNSLNNKLGTGTADNLKFCSVFYTDVDATTVGSEDGGCRLSTTNNAGSDLTLNFNVGFWSSQPNCVCTTGDGSNSSVACSQSVGASSMRIRTFLTTTGANNNATAAIYCIGPK